MKHRLTCWHNEKTKPVHDGLYQVYIAQDTIGWCWFEDGRWGWAYENKSWALQKQWRICEGTGQHKMWRGIVKWPQST